MAKVMDTDMGVAQALCKEWLSELATNTKGLVNRSGLTASGRSRGV